MKVAIMGAGLSGLACAIELERHGIEPIIFEKRRGPGDRFINAEVMISVFARPISDEIEYLSETHQIFLQPTANISRLVLASAHEQAVIEGRIGFSNIRGRHELSFEQQLARQVNAEIHYESDRSYEDLLHEYTHVVVATGDPLYANEIVGFEKDLSVTMMGRTVEGEFSRYTVFCWFDEAFAPKGYAYLIPFSDTEANIVLAFPEYRQITQEEQEKMWNLFQARVEKELQQSLVTTDTFHIHGYAIGLVKHPRVGNTFFTGNNYGSLMPFMGFGQFASILTGIFAAKDICGEMSYETAILNIEQSYKASIVLRRAMEKLDDAGFDAVVKRLSGNLGQWLLHTNHDILKWVSYGLRLWPGSS